MVLPLAGVCVCVPPPSRIEFVLVKRPKPKAANQIMTINVASKRNPNAIKIVNLFALRLCSRLQCAKLLTKPLKKWHFFSRLSPDQMQ